MLSSFNKRAFHFILNGTNFDLLRFPEFQKAPMTVEGRMDFTAQGSGTLDEPIINAQVRLRDLAFDKERAGNFTVDAVTRGADLQLTDRKITRLNSSHRCISYAV